MRNKMTMKRMKIYEAFFIIGFLLLCLSCNKSSQIQDKALTHIDIRSLPEKNILMDNVDKYRFVKLKTTDNCLIREIEKIDFDDDKMFIRDRNNKVFVFDNKGVFLNEIGHVGSGPDEQLGIYDFFLDRKMKQINIFDMLKSTIYFYTYTGELIDSKKLDNNLFKDFSVIDIANDNNLILTLYNSSVSLFNFRVVNGNDYKKIIDCIPYVAVGEEPIAFYLSKTARSREDLYLSAFISDTIYKYDNYQNTILPAIVFEGEYEPLTKEDVADKSFELAMEVNAIAKLKKRSVGIRNLYATNEYLHFLFEMKGKVYRLFWNLERQTGSYYRYVCESTIANFFSYVIGATDDAFVCAIPAYEAIRHNWNENQNAKSVVDNTLEDDNPIIAFYTIINE
ncbi:MAG: hypothetical protein BGO29_01270 [Bacteroidales bacterium 36-12]|nr:MAG: hypothetical protein BGO29_01270 [Bacteroidales bacterium 36-12]